jgi:hypothetical protein
MRHLKTTMIMVASLVLTVFLGLAGCDEDRHFRGDRDRSPRYEGNDNARHEERQASDRHEDRGKDSGHEGERGDR